jgi:hypothetical protein
MLNLKFLPLLLFLSTCCFCLHAQPSLPANAAASEPAQRRVPQPPFPGCPHLQPGLTAFSSLGLSGSNAEVRLHAGMSVLFDVPTFKFEKGLVVESGAKLVFRDQATHVTSTHIMVNGELWAGSEACPFTHKLTIELTKGTDVSGAGAQFFGTKVIAVGQGGVLELHGAKGLGAANSWLKLGATALAGATSITLSSEPQWEIGDEIVIASTDFNM